MMEWEEQREREEFARAAQLYRPLGGAMAARFTPAKGNDNEPDTMKEEVLAEHVVSASASTLVTNCHSHLEEVYTYLGIITGVSPCT